MFWKFRVEVNLFDAVRLAPPFEDGHDFDVPVVVIRERFPISGQFTLLALRIWRGVHHKMIGRSHFLKPAQHASQ